MNIKDMGENIDNIKWVEDRVEEIGKQIKRMYNNNSFSVNVKFEDGLNDSITPFELPKEQVASILLIYIERLEQRALKSKRWFKECGFNPQFDKKFCDGMADVFGELEGLKRYISYETEESKY